MVLISLPLYVNPKENKERIRELLEVWTIILRINGKAYYLHPKINLTIGKKLLEGHNVEK
jgi:hypothetical protein